MTPPHSDALVLFGVTGDLAHKKIFPALYALVKRGALKVSVIGVASPKWSLTDLHHRVKDSIKQSDGIENQRTLNHLLSPLTYLSRDKRWATVRSSPMRTQLKLPGRWSTQSLRATIGLILTSLAVGGRKRRTSLSPQTAAGTTHLFRSIHDQTNGVDGWVSLEVSPVLAHDTAGTSAAARELHAQVERPNLFIKIPGTEEGLPAIEEAIFAGVPINVTLLFSREQYVAAAEAYLRGIERRIAAGLNPEIGSVASMFISRWDVAVMGKAPETLRNQLGIAIAGQTYEAYRMLLDSPHCQRIMNAGPRPQRLLWASTGTKDPAASDTLYIQALAAPFTVNTMPEATLKAFSCHGEIGQTLPMRARDCDEALAAFAKAGIDTDALAAQLQDDGATAFVTSWNDILASIASKGEVLKKDKRTAKAKHT